LSKKLHSWTFKFQKIVRKQIWSYVWDLIPAVHRWTRQWTIIINTGLHLKKLC